MALSQVTGALATWWQTYRNGGLDTGLVYNALVSDLQAGDYLVGARATVVSTGSTSSGNRTLTLSRAGHQWTQTLVAASSIQIMR